MPTHIRPLTHYKDVLIRTIDGIRDSVTVLLRPEKITDPDHIGDIVSHLMIDSPDLIARVSQRLVDGDGGDVAGALAEIGVALTKLEATDPDLFVLVPSPRYAARIRMAAYGVTDYRSSLQFCSCVEAKRRRDAYAARQVLKRLGRPLPSYDEAVDGHIEGGSHQHHDHLDTAPENRHQRP
jgi:hypothetical protein